MCFRIVGWHRWIFRTKTFVDAVDFSKSAELCCNFIWQVVFYECPEIFNSDFMSSQRFQLCQQSFVSIWILFQYHSKCQWIWIKYFFQVHKNAETYQVYVSLQCFMKNETSLSCIRIRKGWVTCLQSNYFSPEYSLNQSCKSGLHDLQITCWF
jgi:hypothetical protein